MKLLEKTHPQNNLELISSVYRSMAVSYKKAIDELERITDKNTIQLILSVAVQNKYLNNLVKEYTGLEVVALPIEATALGNIKI